MNLDFITNAVHDADLLRMMQRAALNLADGMPILWAAKALGSPLSARVAGVDLIDALAARSASDGLSIYLFGAGPGVAEEAASADGAVPRGQGDARRRVVAIADVADMDEAVLTDIVEADPDILCVALGNPKQERWIEQHAGRLGVPVLIGVGGTLDFIVDRRRRAPAVDAASRPRVGRTGRAGTSSPRASLRRRCRRVPPEVRRAVVAPAAAVRGSWAMATGVHHSRAEPRHLVIIRAGPVLDLARDPGLRELRLEGADVRVDLARSTWPMPPPSPPWCRWHATGGRQTLDDVRPVVRTELRCAGVSPLLTRAADDITPGAATP